MDRSASDLILSPMNHVGICEFDVQHDIVFLDPRAEKQRALPVHGQLEMGQKTRPFVVEAVRGCFMRIDVTVSIEQAERVALLQNFDVVIDQLGGGNNVALIRPTIDIIHESLSSVPNRSAQPASERGSEQKGRANTSDSRRLTKPLSDLTEHADPADGGRHRACAVEP